jgi:hypothetical protein
MDFKIALMLKSLPPKVRKTKIAHLMMLTKARKSLLVRKPPRRMEPSWLKIWMMTPSLTTLMIRRMNRKSNVTKKCYHD